MELPPKYGWLKYAVERYGIVHDAALYRVGITASEVTVLAAAEMAEKDAKAGKMKAALETVKGAMEVVSRTELDGSCGRDAIAKRVEKRHGNAMAMAFKEVFDVLAG